MRFSPGLIASVLGLFAVLLVGWGLANVWRIVQSAPVWRMPVGGPKVAAAFLFGALLMVSVPVVADHVTEPVLPIKEIVALNIFAYPDGASKLVACDGSETRTWVAARIEPKLSFETPNGSIDNRNPSEHFVVRITVSRLVPDLTGGGFNIVKDWDALWFHQNREPHATKPQLWEVTQSNTYGLQQHQGLWRVEVRVEGLESGVVLERLCDFEIVAP